jgi:asparagine synthase (glutamine-hydrolysing)
MCGIAGILKLDPSASVETARLERMGAALAHRGPDGSGVFTDGPLGFVHRRLAIVDVAGGAQPMQSAGGQHCVTYNGEIYNHPELAPWLEGLGYRYQTRCDTETLLHLYAHLGDRCVARLRGMYAFALWDRARARLLLARDPLGIKPLYWTRNDTELLFASEIKALLAAGGVKVELDRDVVPEFLATRFVAGESTFFRGVRKLLPGRTLVATPHGELHQQRFWAPSVGAPSDAITFADATREVRAALERAVERHLMSDGPVGVFLSGGLDSSAMAAIAARASGTRLQTFSVGFDDPTASELGPAREVAECLGTQHRELCVPPAAFFEPLPRLVWHEDEPIAFTSSVPLHHLSRLAARHVKVVLTGEGADELFLGYGRYRWAAWNTAIARAAAMAGVAPHRLFSPLLPWMPQGIRRHAARSVLARPGDPRELLFDAFAVFPDAMQRALLADPSLLGREDPYAHALRAYRAAPGGTLERMSVADIETYLVELLMKQDQMSMAASLESRVPFLDLDLVELALRLPARFKLRRLASKAVLREAVRDVVPPCVLTRKKLGFPVPFGRWLRGSHAAWVDGLVLGDRARSRGLFEPRALAALAEEHRSGRCDHGERLWLLINLEIWQRIFVDGEAPAEITGGL